MNALVRLDDDTEVFLKYNMMVRWKNAEGVICEASVGEMIGFWTWGMSNGAEIEEGRRREYQRLVDKVCGMARYDENKGMLWVSESLADILDKFVHL